MTKRTKPKATSTVAPQAPTEAVESVKPKSNTNVASKPKTATKAPQGATGVAKKARTRTKKTLVEKGNDIVYTEAGKQLLDETLATVSKAINVNSRTITYSDQEPKPSLYDRFVGWLYRVTYNFRGY